MNWVIYVLKHPRTLQIRYVGMTTQSVEKRLTKHLADSRRSQQSYRQRGIWALMSVGLVPLIEVIESGSGDGWKAAECRWIAFHRASGARLWNTTDGGDGVLNWGTPEERSALAKERWANKTPEQRADISAKALAWNAARTPEHRSGAAKKRQAMKTPEQRSASTRKGKAAMSSEQRSAAASHARATQLVNTTPEQRSAQAILSAAKANRTRTPEQRSAAARKGHAARTHEQRSAVALHAITARWAKRVD